MVNIKSNKRHMIKSRKVNAANTSFKSSMKTSIKKLESLIEANDAKAIEELKVVTKKVDQAVSKNILHKNKAARMKSTFTKKVNNISK